MGSFVFYFTEKGGDNVQLDVNNLGINKIEGLVRRPGKGKLNFVE